MFTCDAGGAYQATHAPNWHRQAKYIVKRIVITFLSAFTMHRYPDVCMYQAYETVLGKALRKYLLFPKVSILGKKHITGADFQIDWGG